ncbi:hypothetical protein OQA88_12222 [Cercophora sp. LCS_1]
MKETMDGAAKSIDKVAQRILPAHPHHLSLSLDRRYPKPSGFWFEGKSQALQYMTFVSDADRGILIARPSYDICEEEKPAAPMPVKELAKGEVKKKLSIKDYQKKKNSPVSPTESAPPKPEAKPNGTTAASRAKEDEKKEDTKGVEKLDSRSENSRADRPRPQLNGERYAPNKVVGGTPSASPLGPEADLDSHRSKNSQQKPQLEPESRKRNADADVTAPPQKRIKSETMTTKAEPARSAKTETPRSREERPHKSTRDSLHPTVNGLPPGVTDREKDRENTASPRSTIQVNGTRPRSDSGRSTPRKPEASKAAVPQLLSPLHPSLMADLQEMETGKKKTADKMPAKAQKTDGTKKPKASLQIPQLLSPTLPAVVEAELLRLKHKTTPPKGDFSLDSIKTPESPSSARKPKTSTQPAEEEDARGQSPSRIVTIKLKKPMAKRAKELLSLPSKAAKDALKKERSMSVEDTPPPARKRPRLLDDAPPESIASKRPKSAADSVIARPMGPSPSTPLKQSATAMSRVTSSQSQGTPGNSTNLTPGDRPPTRSDSVEPTRAARAQTADISPQDRAAVDALRTKFDKMRVLGSSLKHQRDDITRRNTDERKAMILHIEMLLAYMASFNAHSLFRLLEKKTPDINLWYSLDPHFRELKKRAYKTRPLYALACQLYGVFLECINVAFTSLEAPDPKQFALWVQFEKRRVPAWQEAQTVSDGIDNPKLKAMLGGWMKVDEVIDRSLEVLKRWADRENVAWKPSIEAPGGGAKAPERDRERERDRDRDRGDRERERDRGGGGRGGGDRERDRDRDRDRERDRARVNGSRV